MKNSADCYTVRANHEWANIYLREWVVPTTDGETRYCGEIAINSAFGVYGNFWTHCGVSFKRFLIGVEFSYFMEKTRPTYKRFNFDASMKRIKEHVIECRRYGGLEKAHARAIFDGFEDIEDFGGGTRFVDGLYEIEALRHVTTEPYGFARDMPDPDSRGFWRDIWPVFIAELKTEIAAPVAG